MDGVIVYCIPILRSSYTFLKPEFGTTFKNCSCSKFKPLNLLTLSIKDMIDENQANGFGHQAKTEDGLVFHFSITNNLDNFSDLEDL